MEEAYEKRRVNDLIHKITTSLVKEFVSRSVAPVLEKLNDLSYNTTRNHYARRKKRKVASPPYRKIQSFIEYKMAWHAIKFITLTRKTPLDLPQMREFIPS